MSYPRTKKEIQARIAELEAENEAAPGWGAAVGARGEEIKGLQRHLRYIEADEKRVREMVVDSMTWPLPTLPMKRRNPDGPMAFGTIAEGGEGPITITVTDPAPDVVTFENIEALLEAGWVVD